MRLAVKAKAGVVFGLSETVRVQSMVTSHDFVRSQVRCGRVLQRTGTSMNLRLAFAIWNVVHRRQGRRKGYYDADSVFMLRRSSRVVSAVGPFSPRGERERAIMMVTSGTVRCQPKGRAVEGRIQRTNGMREKSRK
jgi:hypothetical protein